MGLELYNIGWLAWPYVPVLVSHRKANPLVMNNCGRITNPIGRRLAGEWRTNGPANGLAYGLAYGLAWRRVFVWGYFFFYLAIK